MRTTSRVADIQYSVGLHVYRQCNEVIKLVTVSINDHGPEAQPCGIKSTHDVLLSL